MIRRRVMKLRVKNWWIDLPKLKQGAIRWSANERWRSMGATGLKVHPVLEKWSVIHIPLKRIQADQQPNTSALGQKYVGTEALRLKLCVCCKGNMVRGVMLRTIVNQYNTIIITCLRTYGLQIWHNRVSRESITGVSWPCGFKSDSWEAVRSVVLWRKRYAVSGKRKGHQLPVLKNWNHNVLEKTPMIWRLFTFSPVDLIASYFSGRMGLVARTTNNN